MGRGDGANLYQQPELIPVVPAFDDLSVFNPLHRSAANRGFLPGGGESQERALVGHRGSPARHYDVSLFNHAVDGDFEIRKRTAQVRRENTEFLETDVGVMLGLAMADCVWRRHLVDRFHSPFVPDFLKPASN